MGDMGEYWKDIKPHLKERRKQHVRKMGNSATKNIEAWDLNLLIIQTIINLQLIPIMELLTTGELQERGLSAKQKNVVKGYVV